MTVRIHFSAEDLAQIRIAPVGPVDETASAIWLLQRRDGGLLFNGWRRQALARLTTPARRLGQLIPAARCVSLDVFTLSGGPSTSLEQALENLRRRPAADVAREARFADQSRPLQSWARGLAVGDSDSLGLLHESLNSAYQVVVAPHNDMIRSYYAARRAAYAHAFIDGGIDALLRSLHPQIQWQHPVLKVPTPSPSATSGDRHLGGRGIILAPAFFDLAPRVTWDLADPSAPPVLHVPPADLPTRARTLISSGQQTERAGGLAALMGHTRAEMLRHAATGGTTSELAGRVKISISNASEHLTVLRTAGLVNSERKRNAVQHSVTPLGRDLLGQDL